MKFRKWIFKLLTGYDLIEYKKILNDFERSVKLSEQLMERSKSILREASEVNKLNREIIDHYEGCNVNETLG